MKTILAIAISLVTTAAAAAPVDNAKAAIKVGCAAIQSHLPGEGNCDDLAAVLQGDVWTVSQKWVPQDQVGGGAPVVEVSRETGEVLNFYLAE